MLGLVKKNRQCTCGTYIFFYILQPSYSMYVFMQIIITYDAPTWKHFQLRNRLRIFWAKLVQNDQTHQMTPCEKKIQSEYWLVGVLFIRSTYQKMSGDKLICSDWKTLGSHTDNIFSCHCIYMKYSICNCSGQSIFHIPLLTIMANNLSVNMRLSKV